MEINALATLQNTLANVRSRVESRRQQPVENFNEPAVSVNLSGRQSSVVTQSDIDPEEATSILGQVQLSARSNDSFDNVHSLDINRVLQLIG